MEGTNTHQMFHSWSFQSHPCPEWEEREGDRHLNFFAVLSLMACSFFFPWNKEKRGACLSWYFLVLFVLVLYCLVSATLSHSLLIILVSFIFLLLFCSKSWRKMGDLLALSEKLTLFTWNSLTGDASWQYVSAPHYLIRDVDSYESIYSSPLMTVPLTPIYWL